MYCVVVTYGNACPYSKFASGLVLREDAERLKALAIDLGYRDATIWREKDFKAFFAEKLGKQGDKKGTDQKARSVHGVRT